MIRFTDADSLHIARQISWFLLCIGADARGIKGYLMCEANRVNASYPSEVCRMNQTTCCILQLCVWNGTGQVAEPTYVLMLTCKLP